MSEALRFIVPFACAGAAIAAGVAVRWVLERLQVKGVLKIDQGPPPARLREQEAPETQVLAPYREAPSIEALELRLPIQHVGERCDERLLEALCAANIQTDETIKNQRATIEALERRLLGTARIPGACFDGVPHEFNPIYHYCQRCGGRAER